MPYHFEYDSQNKILMAKFEGQVTDGLIKDYYQACTSQVAVTDLRGSLTDFSNAASFDVSAETIREIAALAPADPIASRPRVVVAPASHIFGFARMFGILGEATRPNFHVVRTLREAYALLGIASPQFKPLQAGFQGATVL